MYESLNLLIFVIINVNVVVTQSPFEAARSETRAISHNIEKNVFTTVTIMSNFKTPKG